MQRISWLREEQKLLGLDCAILGSSELWHRAACCVVIKVWGNIPSCIFVVQVFQNEYGENIYSFFLVWPLLHTHCRCTGLPLRQITPNDTQTHAQTHTHTHKRYDSSGRGIGPSQTSTWQNTTFTRDRHPWPRRNSNPHSQQASGRWPAP